MLLFENRLYIIDDGNAKPELDCSDWLAARLSDARTWVRMCCSKTTSLQPLFYFLLLSPEPSTFEYTAPSFG